MGNTDFSEVQFNGEVDFGNAQFWEEANFRGAQFKEYTEFREAQFTEKADFYAAQFKGYTDFSVVQFKGEIIFSRILIEDYIEFSKSKISGHLRFEDINLFKASFIDVDLSNVDFIRCGWPKKRSGFLKRKLFEQAKRNVLYDEILINSRNKSYEDVEKLYQQMKEKYKGNEPEVSNWHYGQREMFRKKSMLRRYNPFSFSNLYWVFSGYGERPIRAGIMLICIFITVTFLNNYFGIVTADGRPINGISEIKGFSWELNYKKFWLLVNNSFQNIFFVKEPYFIPMTKVGETFILLITKAIIPLQAALFGFALRNKFRR